MNEIKFDSRTKKYLVRRYDEKNWQTVSREEALSAIFDGIQLCVEKNCEMPAEIKVQYETYLPELMLSDDIFGVTYRTLTSLTRGLLRLAVCHDTSPKHHYDHWLGLEGQIKDLWIAVICAVIKGKAPNSMRAMFEAYHEYAFSLYVSYGAVDGKKFLSSLRKELQAIRTDTLKKEFFACAPDDYNYVRTEKGRDTSPANMTAFIALEELAVNPDDAVAKEYVRQFKGFSSAIHRVSGVFPDCLSVKFTVDSVTKDRTYWAPKGTKDIEAQDAIDKLLDMAEDEELDPLIRFTCYENLKRVCSATKAMKYTKKQIQLAKNAQEVYIIQPFDEFTVKGHAMTRGIALNSLTALLCTALFISIRYWWESAVSSEFKSFWVGPPGLVIITLAVIFFLAWADRDSNSATAVILGPGWSASMAFFRY